MKNTENEFRREMHRRQRKALQKDSLTALLLIGLAVGAIIIFILQTL